MFIFYNFKKMFMEIERLPMNEFKNFLDNHYKIKKQISNKKTLNNITKEKIYLKNERRRIKKAEIRLKAMYIISNNKIECNNCKCNDIRILEINHKSGGGNKEKKQKYFNDKYLFYKDIVSGKRSIKDLELLCKLCNIHHYIQNILGIRGHTISYNFS